ncbi:MAG: glucose-6-phosphate isomerase [Pseudohongiellaceae bacterium]
MKSVYSTQAWPRLQQHASHLQHNDTTLNGLFDSDPERVARYSLEAAGLYLDYSRHHADGQAWSLLHSLTEECALPGAIRAMFAGKAVNHTEQRPALHVALRGHVPQEQPDVAGQVAQQLEKMTALCEALRQGRLTGSGGHPINTLVNLGIGGSDLGPAMACDALWPWHRKGLSCHFVSNIDPAHLHRTLQGLDPQTTLFIVASKSFRTAETLTNAQAARAWLEQAGICGDAIRHHFMATTAQPERAIDFGIQADHILPMYDWTGGRFSLWSCIGLPLAMMIGMPAFREMLDGARQMDHHFLETPTEGNMPVILALLDIWNRLYLGSDSRVVLPYSQSLAALPAFLQQLEMESLGKNVTLDGNRIEGPTGLMVWGSQGTNGQHSFHQLLHQGSQPVAADFIAVARGCTPNGSEAHRQLLAHCLAQSRALMAGKSHEQARREMLDEGMDESEAERLAPHRAVPGNRPSTTLLLPALTPASLGALLALYEHKVCVLGVLWGINAFDQWGVELGKALSGSMLEALVQGPDGTLDASTRELVRRSREHEQE